MLNLNQRMRCGVFVTEDSRVLIVHDRVLESEVQWVECDPEAGAFSLIYEDGRAQELGISMSPDMQGYLAYTTEIILSQLQDNQLKNSQKVSFIYKDVG